MIEQPFSDADRAAFSGEKYLLRASLTRQDICVKGGSLCRPDGSPAADPQGVDSVDAPPVRPIQSDFDAVASEAATLAQVNRVLKYVLSTRHPGI